MATHYFRRATAPPKGSFVLTYPISTAFCRLSSPPSCSGDTAAGGAGVNDRVAVNGPETAEKSQLKPVDAFEHLPEKDIFREPSLERWEKRLTGAEKWQEKQEVIDALTQVIELYGLFDHKGSLRHFFRRVIGLVGLSLEITPYLFLHFYVLFKMKGILLWYAASLFTHNSYYALVNF